MAGFHTQVSLHGFQFQDDQLTVKLASGITKAAVGKAVTIDTSADNQVKLAGDGDEIVGVLLTVEDRKVEGQLIGTVGFRFATKLKVKTGQTVTRGSLLVGAGDGEVKAIAVDSEDTADLAVKAARAPIAWTAPADGLVVATKLT